MRKYKILIVDDHTLFCEGLRELLKFHDNLQVVGIAKNGREAILATERYKPDIVLLDIEMPDMSGLEALLSIKKTQPDVIVIILTMHREERYLVEALEAGACGYVLKNWSLSELFDMINASVKGQIRLEYRTVRKILRDFSRKNREMGNEILTKREIEILRLVANGYSNKEISKKLNVSEYTVKNHLANIYRKLDCRGRVQALNKARQLKMI